MKDDQVDVFSGLKRNPVLGSPLGLEAAHEDLLLKGFHIVPGHLSQARCKAISAEIDSLEAEEIERWGKQTLSEINDLGVVRNPFLSSEEVMGACFDRTTLDICEAIFGRQYILHVNRAVINRSGSKHPASTWHREPPYQQFTTSRPISLSFVIIIDPSTPDTGGIRLLQGSHKWEGMPTDDYILRNALIPSIPAGAILVIDSALFHSNSLNNTKTRRSLVTIFTTPLIKQQTNIARMIGSNSTILDRVSHIPEFAFLFGIETDPFDSDDLYRRHKQETGSPIC